MSSHIVETRQDELEAGRAVAASNRWVALFLLLLLNTFLTLDKTIFLILLEPIRAEFQLSDMMLGALSGSAFALCMGLAGLPLGVLVDRVNRRNLAAICLAVWSAMTIVTGAARNFVQLLLARMMVGFGEAGGAPAALSIIADLFEHKRRATAMSIYALGPPLATLISLSAGTWVVHNYGWRTTLVAAGLPGLVLAMAMLLLLREPPRGGAAKAAQTHDETHEVPSLGAALRTMAGIPSFIHLVLGVFLSFVVLAGVSTFTNSFLVRVHGVKLSEIGPYLGVLMSVIGVAASTSVGVLTDTLARRDERWRGWIMALGSLASAVLGWSFLLAPSLPVVLGLVALFAASATYWMGPAYSLCQSLAPLRMRGKAVAAMLLIGNTGGYVIGPAAVGFVSDKLRLEFADDGLRYAMLAAVTVNLWAAVHFRLMARHLPRDLTKSRDSSAAL